MRNRFKAILISVISILLLASTSGCSIVASNKIDSEQIEQDLKQHQVVINCFESKYVATDEFIFERYEIIKRKIDSDAGTDMINCYIYASNEYFSAKLEAVLKYSYYDVGGWVLDDLSILSKEIMPLRTPNFDIAREEIISAFEMFNNSNGYFYNNSWKEVEGWLLSFIDLNGSGNDFSRHLNDFKFENFELLPDGLTCKLNVSFISSLTETNGYFLFKFNNSTGWQWVNQENTNNNLPAFGISNYKADYSEALGTFMGFDYGRMSYKILDIIEISDAKIKVNITHNVGYYNEYTKSEEFNFDIYSGHFYDGSFTGGEYYYNSSTKCWEEINYGVKRIDSYKRTNYLS